MNDDDKKAKAPFAFDSLDSVFEAMALFSSEDFALAALRLLLLAKAMGKIAADERRTTKTIAQTLKALSADGEEKLKTYCLCLLAAISASELLDVQKAIERQTKKTPASE